MSVLPALALPKIRFDGRRQEKVSLSVWFHQTPVLKLTLVGKRPVFLKSGPKQLLSQALFLDQVADKLAQSRKEARRSFGFQGGRSET
jgi:hypothetical protein